MRPNPSPWWILLGAGAFAAGIGAGIGGAALVDVDTPTCAAYTADDAGARLCRLDLEAAERTDRVRLEAATSLVAWLSVAATGLAAAAAAGAVATGWRDGRFAGADVRPGAVAGPRGPADPTP